ncbi:hypothetical protein G3M48_002995 [Beauveria asiatica]|uniref:Uncharacterized protein n=1 Tax=Beauveria asiatica TaxID=1069075 RepID=A0AAW0RWZ0_9HYPO
MKATELSKAENGLEEATEETGDAETGDAESDEAESDEAENGEAVQPPPGVSNADTDGPTVEHTGPIHCGETRDMNDPLTPPDTNVPALGAHQAQPITEIHGAVTGSTSLAPLLERSSPVFCPPVSDSEKEHNVMETVFLCCLHFNFQLSRYRKQNTTTMIRTEVSDIQRHVTGVMKLPYGRAVDEIKKEHTAFHSKKMQARYMESIFWHFIEETAKNIKPEDCPVPRGPLDGFTRQEKRAHQQFMVDAGYKTGSTNVRHYRLLWKHLYTLREGGVDKILLYRTREFNSFCESFRADATPSLLDTVMPWEERYGSQINLLERRIEHAAKNKMGEDPLRSQPDIAARLKVDRKAWNIDSNRWYSEQEASDFRAAHGPLLADNVPLGSLRDIPIKKGENRDMSLFVILKPQGIEEMIVCPVITIKPGDFLGIFSGEIRYSTTVDGIYGIPGPQEKLWLDYSRITGALNLMGVTLPGQDANVYLQWESYQPDKKSQAVWRIAVRAARAIRPFEEITRSACHQLQYQLHQDGVSARRGFLKAS